MSQLVRQRRSNGEVARLRQERRKVEARLAQLDLRIARMRPRTPPSAGELNRWFDDLSRGLPDLPPLPPDFSRADLYDDHD